MTDRVPVTGLAATDSSVTFGYGNLLMAGNSGTVMVSGNLVRLDSTGNVRIMTTSRGIIFPDGSFQSTASSGASISVTNDVATNASTYYPSLTNNVTSGTLSALVTSSTKLFYNPSTGALSSTVFNGNSEGGYVSGTVFNARTSLIAATVTSNGAISGTTFGGTVITASTGFQGGYVSGTVFNASGAATVSSLTSNGAVSGTTVTGSTGFLGGAVSGTVFNARTSLIAATVTSNGAVTGTTFIPTGSTAPSDGMFLPTTNTVGFATNSIERMRIDSNGKVGIGTSVLPALFNIVTSPLSSGSSFVVDDYASGTGRNLYLAIDNYSSAAEGGGLELVYRRGTKASPATVQVNDVLGWIDTGGSDGSAGIQYGSSIRAVVDSAPSTGFVPTAWVFQTGSTGYGTENMRITSAGNVGIGTSTVAAPTKLYVQGGNIVIGGTGYGLRFPDGTFMSTASAGGSITVTNDVATNANTYYPSLTNNVTSGTLSALVTSSTKLFYNPSTGALNSTVFNGNSEGGYVSGTVFNARTSLIAATVTSNGAVTGTTLIPTGSTAPTNGVFLPATNTVGFATNSTERARITAAGNLLIGGTTAPIGGNARVMINSTGTNGGGLQLAGGAAGGAALEPLNGGGLSFDTYTGAVGSETYTERVRITSVGDVGIGTSSTTAKTRIEGTLQVTGWGANPTTGAGIEFNYGALANLAIMRVYDRNASAYRDLRFDAATYEYHVSGFERMKLDSAGNVGIGTSTISTGDKLAVFGGNIDIGTVGNGLRFPDNTFQTTAATGGGATITNDTSTNSDNYFPAMTSNQTSGTWTSAITSSTKLYFNPSTGTLNATVFNSLSDATAKTNITPIMGATDLIDALTGVRFSWRDNSGKSAGLIAQDVEKIMPELVSTAEHGKSLNYNGVIGLLVEAIKDLKQQVSELRSRLDA